MPTVTYHFNKDGIADILLAGNEYETDVSTGRYDASYGLILTGNINKTYNAIPQNRWQH